MTTALFLLRCIQTGLSMNDLECLDIGMVFDMFTELGNDSCEYDEIATAEDIDKF